MATIARFPGILQAGSAIGEALEKKYAREAELRRSADLQQRQDALVRGTGYIAADPYAADLSDENIAKVTGTKDPSILALVKSKLQSELPSEQQRYSQLHGPEIEAAFGQRYDDEYGPPVPTPPETPAWQLPYIAKAQQAADARNYERQQDALDEKYRRDALAQAERLAKERAAQKEPRLRQFELDAAGYGQRLQNADRILSKIGGDFTGAQNYITGSDYFPNIAKSSDRQQFEQAQRDFVNAALREESGAVINEDEFQNARRQYFPQPGDTQDVLAQKAANRAQVIANFKKTAGPAWEEVTGEAPAPPPGQQPQAGQTPSQSETMQAYRAPDGSLHDSPIPGGVPVQVKRKP